MLTNPSVPYNFCVGDPISCLLTVGLMLVYHSVSMPSRGLLRYCTTSPINHLQHYTWVGVARRCQRDGVLLVDPRRAEVRPLLPAVVVEEPDLDVLLGDLLAQDDDLLAALGRCGVVRHVHDLKLLLGLRVKDGLRTDRRQDDCVLARCRGVLKRYLNIQCLK